MMRSRSSRLTLVAMTLLLASGCGYNTIQTLDEQVNKAEGNIKAQLQRRADLVPNLVATVKGFAQQESTIFIRVAEARSRLSGAVQSGDVGQMAEANAALSAPLSRLLAISEAYPDLKSNQNFLQLQDELTGTENRISVARQDYNSSVESFNAYIRRFPYNLTAKMFGHGAPRKYFQTTAGAEEVPKVQF